MWRVKSFAAALFSAILTFSLHAQNPEPILEFLGTDSMEELNPYDVERLENLLEHPLKLNYSSESKLEESGLLSRYQIASLTDYRSRHGDVLSFAELAAVDGFGRSFVSRISPFVSLESRRLPGAGSSPSMRNEISIRTGFRQGPVPTYGMKYRFEAGERLSGGLSVSRTSGADRVFPDAGAGYISFHFMRFPGKIIAGAFNARFGQGLALWNGMSISGLTSASSFMRKPSGISASSSFTGEYAYHGIAAEAGIGHASVTVLAALDREGRGVLPGANLSWYFRNGQISMTHYADFSFSEEVGISDMKTSADMAFCFNGMDMFAESSFDWAASALAALCGLSAPIGDDVRLAAMLRYYPSSFTASRSAAARSTTKCSNEHAASLALDFFAGPWVTINGASGFGSSVRRHSGKVSADFAYFPEAKSDDAAVRSIQMKAQAEWAWMMTGSFKAAFKVSERIRTWGEPFRTDIRTDISYMSEKFLANLRLNALRSAGTGFLAYLEGGCKAEKALIYLRAGAFRIDNWADRIYAYERDAPGSFNVPAFYGRGVWTALTMNWKFARWGRFYARAAVTSYPFMEEKKPGRAELKFQAVFDL